MVTETKEWMIAFMTSLRSSSSYQATGNGSLELQISFKKNKFSGN